MNTETVIEINSFEAEGTFIYECKEYTYEIREEECGYWLSINGNESEAEEFYLKCNTVEENIINALKVMLETQKVEELKREAEIMLNKLYSSFGYEGAVAQMNKLIERAKNV